MATDDLDDLRWKQTQRDGEPLRRLKNQRGNGRFIVVEVEIWRFPPRIPPGCHYPQEVQRFRRGTFTPEQLEAIIMYAGSLGRNIAACTAIETSTGLN